MTSPPDDISLLKAMRDRGEISDDQYDVLRRHVLWGTPLPDSLNLTPDEPENQPAPPTAMPPSAKSPLQPLPPERTAANLPQRGLFSALPTNQAPANRSPVRQQFRPPNSPLPAAFRPAPPNVRPALPTVRPPGLLVPPPGPLQTINNRTNFEISPAKSDRKTRWQLLTFIVVVLLGVAGGVWFFVIREKPVSATHYAQTVCAAMQNWQQDVAIARQVYAGQNKETDPAAIRNNTVALYEKIEQRTGQLAEDVRASGKPQVTNGDKYAKQLYDLFAQASQGISDDTGQARQADPSQPTVLHLTVLSLTNSLDGRLATVTGALADNGENPPPELRTAFHSQPSCTAFAG